MAPAQVQPASVSAVVKTRRENHLEVCIVSCSISSAPLMLERLASRERPSLSHGSRLFRAVTCQEWRHRSRPGYTRRT